MITDHENHENHEKEPAKELPEIQLRPVDSQNWKAVVDMSVSIDQEEFISENWYALLQWKFAETPENMRLFCVYAEDIAVGFVMYGLDRESHRWILTRFMVDAKHQGKGYGRAMLLSLLDSVRESLGNIAFYTCIDGQNEAAIKLYESAGFEMTGETMWHEEVLKIML
jgi:diamine N-acetyltransferase